MIELQNSNRNPCDQSAIAAFLNNFVAKVRYSVSNFFCVKQQESIKCEDADHAALSQIQDQIIEFTVTAKQPQKPQKQLKIAVRKGELMEAKCVGNKISSMKTIIRKNLTEEQFRYFNKHCIQRYRLAYDKSCIFIFFLFLRVMLELNQISHASFKHIYRLLQKSLRSSMSWYKANGHGYKSRRKIINSIILGEYLNLSMIPLQGGKYKAVSKVFSSFFVNKTNLNQCLEKIENVINDHPSMADLFSDLQ